jgi:hypothetical protein
VESAVATYTPTLLLASAFVNLPGEAAAEADDPYPVAPGAFSYTPVIEFTSEDAIGGARYFATDSRFNDFLWQLRIGTEDVITNPGDLLVSFVSNPILSLNDSFVAAQVRSRITVSGGTASLASFELFSTTYLVDQPIEYGYGVEADLAKASVPEPSALLLVGLCSLVVSRRIIRSLPHRSRLFCQQVKSQERLARR